MCLCVSVCVFVSVCVCVLDWVFLIMHVSLNFWFNLMRSMVCVCLLQVFVLMGVSVYLNVVDLQVYACMYV